MNTCKDCCYGEPTNPEDKDAPIQCQESPPQVVILPMPQQIQGAPPQLVPMAVFPQLPPHAVCGKFATRNPFSINK